MKVAVTLRFWLMVRVQVVAVPQVPLQPVNTEPAAGTAVSVTLVPLLKGALQVAPQSTPAGADVTVREFREHFF